MSLPLDHSAGAQELVVVPDANVTTHVDIVTLDAPKEEGEAPRLDEVVVASDATDASVYEQMQSHHHHHAAKRPRTSNDGFLVEYSITSRATCKSWTCQKAIERGTMRIAKLRMSPFGTGEVCFSSLFLRIWWFYCRFSVVVNISASLPQQLHCCSLLRAMI